MQNIRGSIGRAESVRGSDGSLSLSLLLSQTMSMATSQTYQRHLQHQSDIAMKPILEL